MGVSGAPETGVEVRLQTLRRSPPICTIAKIIEEQYYDYQLDKTNPKSIIVFGHTHVPDNKIVQKQSMSKYTEKSTITNKTKTFINCGAWITPKEPAQNDLLTRFFNLFIKLKPQKRGQKYTVPSNTFVYIDREGPPLLLQWNDEEHMRFVQGFKLPEQSAAH